MKYGAKDNEIADRLRAAGDSFLQSAEWAELRQKVIDTYGRRCMKCNFLPSGRRNVANVDHIKPRKTHPWLALVFDNLQVLCSRCNRRKANRHCTDYRGRLHKEWEPALSGLEASHLRSIAME